MKKKLQKKFNILSKSGYIFFKLFPQKIIRILIKMFRYNESKLGFGLRYILYKILCNSFGDKVIIFPSVFIFKPENLQIGNNVSIHEFSYIDATGSIKIGNNVMIAHRCTIMSTTHIKDSKRIPFKKQGITKKPVVIGNNCWIGADVKIINGIKIGNNIIIGAGSVVNKDISDNSIVAGVPAKVIK